VSSKVRRSSGYCDGSIRPAFLGKAEENLAAAESEFANRRYNSTPNRCYYACFQAAVYALLKEGIRPPNRPEVWGDDFVQAQFNGLLIHTSPDDWGSPALLVKRVAPGGGCRVVSDGEDRPTPHDPTPVPRYTGTDPQPVGYQFRVDELEMGDRCFARRDALPLSPFPGHDRVVPPVQT
jgi:hypothetical protein